MDIEEVQDSQTCKERGSFNPELSFFYIYAFARSQRYKNDGVLSVCNNMVCHFGFYIIARSLAKLIRGRVVCGRGTWNLVLFAPHLLPLQKPLLRLHQFQNPSPPRPGFTTRTYLD